MENPTNFAPSKPSLITPQSALNGSGLIISDELRRKIALMGSDNGSPVLILGPTGVGKTEIAKQLHQSSQRRDKPFSHINVAAIPAGLAESELFGHMKGSFTDARKNRVGLMKAVGEGTLFLDEIGHLALGIQAKLLLAIEERKIRQVGTDDSIDIHCRIIAATNVPIAQAIRKGEFREDLYHRLSKWVLKLPSLQDRRTEIPAFVKHFLIANDAEHLSFSDAAMEMLCAHSWPGNIRELKTVIERVCHIDSFSNQGKDRSRRVILATGVSECINDELQLDPLPNSHSDRNEYIPASGVQILTLSHQEATALFANGGLNKFLVENEAAAILKILVMNHLSRTKTAEILDISRKTLWEKLKAIRTNVDSLPVAIKNYITVNGIFREQNTDDTDDTDEIDDTSDYNVANPPVTPQSVEAATLEEMTEETFNGMMHIQKILESDDDSFKQFAAKFKQLYLTDKKQIPKKLKFAVILRAFVYMSGKDIKRTSLGDVIGITYYTAYQMLKNKESYGDLNFAYTRKHREICIQPRV